MEHLVCHDFKMVDNTLSDDEYDNVWNLSSSFIQSLASKHSLTLGQKTVLLTLMQEGRCKKMITDSKWDEVRQILSVEGYDCHLE